MRFPGWTSLVLTGSAILSLLLLSAPAPAHADLQGMIPFVDWIDPVLVWSRFNDSRFSSQTAELKALAAEALTHPLYSVVSSAYPPPNGDPHLYYSWAPYWNPVPSCNLSDPTYMSTCNYTNLDGIFNPDITLASQVRSLANVTSDTLTLALVGAATSNAVMLQRAALNLRLFYIDSLTWMKPNFTYAQVQRGANSPQPWIGRQYGIIDGRAQIYALQAAQILFNQTKLSGWVGVDRFNLNFWFYDFTHWLNTSTFGVDERGRSEQSRDLVADTGGHLPFPIRLCGSLQCHSSSLDQ